MDEPVCRSLGLDQRKLPAETFERLESRAGVRRHWLDRERLARESFGRPGRDPVRLGDAAGLVATLGGWTPHLRIAELNTHWDRVVGADVARHSPSAPTPPPGPRSWAIWRRRSCRPCGTACPA